MAIRREIVLGRGPGWSSSRYWELNFQKSTLSMKIMRLHHL